MSLAAQGNRQVFVIPNFHPASCGWLTDFSKERVYCANSYFDHLDRVGQDPHYSFVLSECNNLIAMMNFKPERMAELKRRIRERRVELVNAFFLESTINLSGGEALVRLGVEGLRWQQKVFGVRPRYGWIIDVCGTHEQMAQICAGLGLDAMVYTRLNPTGEALHWAESPDGSRVLAISPGTYWEFKPFFATRQPLAEKELKELRDLVTAKEKITPAGAPVVILGGRGDYNLAPDYPGYPREFLQQWRSYAPDVEVRFTTLSHFVDAVMPLIRSGKVKLKTMRGGTGYDHFAFWFQNPRTKQWFRRNEHALYSAEALLAAASLDGGLEWPSKDLYHCWLQMFLNMDRNTLWGAAGGMVFEHPQSWDARDRYEAVESTAHRLQQTAARALTSRQAGRTLFNPLTWKRESPATVQLPEGSRLSGVDAERLTDGRVLIASPVPAFSGVWCGPGDEVPGQREVPLPEAIETDHYIARFDAVTGDLRSLRVKPSGWEVLGSGANAVLFERLNRKTNYPGDLSWPREERTIVTGTPDVRSQISATRGPHSLTVTALCSMGGASCKRVVRFHFRHPRIDFETELLDVPDRTIVSVEFPLKDPVQAVRRGIPYGFALQLPERGKYPAAIEPAIRWSHYSTSGGGVALLDRGVTGRELAGQTAMLLLLNTMEQYRGYACSWLSGKGKLAFEYALLAHEGAWGALNVPRLAFEFNTPLVVAEGSPKPLRLIETSANVLVEGLRRTGQYLELRMVECLGQPGEAQVRVEMPHLAAELATLDGRLLRGIATGKLYRFAVKPQQIVTLRLKTASAVTEPDPVTRWDEMVPPYKRARLYEYTPDKGHPPHGW